MKHYHPHLDSKQPPATGILGKLDVRVRFVYLLLGLLASLASDGLVVPGVLGVGGILLMRFSGMSASGIVPRLLTPFSIAGLVAFAQLFLHEGRELFSFSVLHITFAATYEGMQMGLLIGIKVISAAALTWSFIAFTPVHRILAVTQWARVPAVFTELMALVFRYLFVLLETVLDIKNAQTLRGGYTSFRHSIRSAATLAGMTFIKTWEQADQASQAMTCRCYDGRIYLKPLDRLTFWHYGQIVVGITLFMMTYV